MALNHLNLSTLLLSFGTCSLCRSIKISATEGMSSLFSFCGPKAFSPSCTSQRINLSRVNNAEDIIQPVLCQTILASYSMFQAREETFFIE